MTSVQGGRYKEEKAFASDAVADALKRHWTAIDHFENNGLADKVAKHVDGFKA
ncbi:FIMAH domain-containing protein [Virgibacillus pantothenticus]|uniref:FIMAH domain-containing protein n=1 Tax=Virgibacillus pantothenticus TaxID=1473 RepID=UPI003D2D10FE